jgi:hypothetical protein
MGGGTRSLGFRGQAARVGALNRGAGFLVCRPESAGRRA